MLTISPSTPPKRKLPIPAAFSNLETDDSGDVYMSGADLSNCFYHLRVPAGMEDWFTLPAIRAGAVPGLCERLSVGPNEQVVPALQVLPMGWSWSLHIAQKVHEFRLRQCGVSDDTRILDKVASVPLSRDVVHSATYVDNHLLLSQDPHSVSTLETSVRHELNSNNLPTHEHIDICTACDVVRLRLGGHSHETRHSPHRALPP